MDRPSWVRTLSPPRRVWVEVRRLLRLGVDDYGLRPRDGLRIESEVPGLLHEWILREEGGWLGMVTFQLVSATEQWSLTVTVPVPAHLIRRRGMTRRDRLRDERRTHG
ncbi:hypothetical protein LWP59_31305 [Amycolatopsis acidiphila]|uniref:hypothetical protein n=1 Tax=Amycolatopsis acidiphila TaxID=715473 RepID=UPI00174A8479|nr:hypothetical protein [Amycolatopsis acidiphila]UIJ58560.1 hypothetical protein LWP59_31305 [Amycolatopsis acidiphila]GHG76853.1 hypothetical protein GCM10017788_42660 [Amycolatopsis acidiphila]